MSRLKKTKFEEIRVQVSISYDFNINKKEDSNLLTIVKDVDGFKASEQQPWGVGCQTIGFLIFVGDRIPSIQDKQNMIDSVNNAVSKL